MTMGMEAMFPKTNEKKLAHIIFLHQIIKPSWKIENQYDSICTFILGLFQEMYMLWHALYVQKMSKNTLKWQFWHAKCFNWKGMTFWSKMEIFSYHPNVGLILGPKSIWDHRPSTQCGSMTKKLAPREKEKIEQMPCDQILQTFETYRAFLCAK